jgi:hypothetical protein
MNIFVINLDPVVAAQQLVDSHVTKMTVETAQMLSTAHRVLDGSKTLISQPNERKKHSWIHPNTSWNERLYAATHINHPCSLWVRESKQNYLWLYSHFRALANEYFFRYDREHLSYTKLRHILRHAPLHITDGSMTPFAQAMPDVYRDSNVLTAYRNYYNAKPIKKNWKRRDIPDWIILPNPSHEDHVSHANI